MSYLSDDGKAIAVKSNKYTSLPISKGGFRIWK